MSDNAMSPVRQKLANHLEQKARELPEFWAKDGSEPSMVVKDVWDKAHVLAQGLRYTKTLEGNNLERYFFALGTDTHGICKERQAPFEVALQGILADIFPLTSDRLLNLALKVNTAFKEGQTNPYGSDELCRIAMDATDERGLSYLAEKLAKLKGDALSKQIWENTVQFTFWLVQFCDETLKAHHVPDEQFHASLAALAFQYLEYASKPSM